MYLKNDNRSQTVTDEAIIKNFFLSLSDPANAELYESVETVDEIVSADPIGGWQMVTKLIAAASSEDELGYVAAGPLEDLLRLHGSTVAAAIRQEALKSQRVRDALGCVLLHPLPPEVDASLGEWVPKL
jgi:hypothetical protein